MAGRNLTMCFPVTKFIGYSQRKYFYLGQVTQPNTNKVTKGNSAEARNGKRESDSGLNVEMMQIQVDNRQAMYKNETDPKS